MIVKNEEEVLDGCLESIKDICDEIIIVDTGSTDQTKRIARNYTDKIYDFQWIDDFSAARNYAFSKATKDYILWLDADDILYEEDQAKLKHLKRTLNNSVDSVSMLYILNFDQYDNPSFYFRRNRLVKRANQFKWKGAVHEYLEVGGTIIEADIAVVHRKKDKKVNVPPSNRNIRIYEKRLKNGEKFTPRDLYYYANELMDHKQFKRALEYYEKFISGEKGWYEDKIHACLRAASIYRMDKNQEKELDHLLKTFRYDTPRAETCCKLGDLFMEKKQVKQSIYWYERALEENITQQGFQHAAYSTWYPHLSLCAAYWKAGNKEKSFEHHQIVKRMRPNDPKILYNENFFTSMYQDENNKRG